MVLVFFNVGWMTRYDGIDDDSLKGGGKYNQHGVGHEVCNFSDNRGTLYGYVQPVGETIKLEKLGASPYDDSIDGVTVVWTAGPKGGGTAVVGWYRDATVYRHPQEIPKPSKMQKKNRIATFRVLAPVDKAVLLPVHEREVMIPRAIKGGIGQSNVWFAQQPESRDIVDRVKALINRASVPPLPDVDQGTSAQEGNPRLTAHLRRERNAKLVEKKKTAVRKATGKLCCEVCGFDFKEEYGELGEGFCEVHHLTPLHLSDGNTTTTLEDLAIVCSNCHRVIHRTNPMPGIRELSRHLRRRFG